MKISQTNNIIHVEPTSFWEGWDFSLSIENFSLRDAIQKKQLRIRVDDQTFLATSNFSGRTYLVFSTIRINCVQIPKDSVSLLTSIPKRPFSFWKAWFSDCHRTFFGPSFGFLIPIFPFLLLLRLPERISCSEYGIPYEQFSCPLVMKNAVLYFMMAPVLFGYAVYPILTFRIADRARLARHYKADRLVAWLGPVMAGLILCGILIQTRGQIHWIGWKAFLGFLRLLVAH